MTTDNNKNQNIALAMSKSGLLLRVAFRDGKKALKIRLLRSKSYCFLLLKPSPKVILLGMLSLNYYGLGFEFE